MPHVKFVDSNESFPAEDGETVLTAAQRAGIALPYSCQVGTCGTCKCELVNGHVFELEYSEIALPAEERIHGRVLACRTQVWGDTVIRRLDDNRH